MGSLGSLCFLEQYSFHWTFTVRFNPNAYTVHNPQTAWILKIIGNAQWERHTLHLSSPLHMLHCSTEST